MKSSKARGLAVLLFPVLLLVLSGCGEQTPSMFRPDSEGARHISNLTYAVFAILAGVAVTVWVLLAITIIRDRRRRPDSEVEQTHGNATIEIIWTLIPAVIITVLLILTIRTTGLLTTSAGNVMFKVTGYQWWWGIEYTDGEFLTANEIHVPLDRQVTADLVSNDVIHSFWVPQMGGKVDMIPGHVRQMTFVPQRVGEYLGECSEFCGHQHGRMRFLLIVETPADFSDWFQNEQREAAKPSGALATAGAEAIGKLACIGCHTIRGTQLARRHGTGPDALRQPAEHRRRDARQHAR